MRKRRSGEAGTKGAAAAAFVAVATLVLASGLASGCSPRSSGKPLSESEKELMSQPVGSVKMPAEAAEAMRKGRSGPPPPGPPATSGAR